MSFWQTQLFFSLSVFLVATCFTRSRAIRTALLVGALALGFITLNGLSLAAYVRSFTDDLAITTLLLLIWRSLQALGLVALEVPRTRIAMMTVFAILALVLYPATLGLSYSDPYRLGFNPRPLIMATALLAFVLLSLRNTLAVVMLAGATLAFALRSKPSENYWDYLIDPFLAVYCCATLLIISVRALIRRRGLARGRPAGSTLAEPAAHDMYKG